jgi:hypothetical protein
VPYGQIIQDAWRLTWRHRFLWIFGLFAGAGGGSCGLNSGSGFRSPGGGGSTDDLRRGVSTAADAAGQWVASHLALVLAAFAAFFLLGLVFIILHFVAKGALIGSSARLAMGESVTRGQGWAMGRRFAWTYARLTVLFFAIGVIALLAVALGVGLVVVLAAISRLLAVIVGALLGLVGVAALVAGWIGLSIVQTYADRAIAVDELGARAAFRRGIALLRLRLGPSLILWLVSLALGIGVGIAFVVLALVLLVPIGGVVVAAYFAGGVGATIAVGAVGFVLFLLVLWGLGGIAGAYLSTYWTLGYLSATDRLSTAVAPP